MQTATKRFTGATTRIKTISTRIQPRARRAIISLLRTTLPIVKNTKKKLHIRRKTKGKLRNRRRGSGEDDNG